jgi:lipoprotein LprG
MPTRNFLGFITLLVAAAAYVACGGGGGADGVDAAQVLSRATAAVRQVKTLHFKLTHENGTTPMPLSLELVSAEGDVVVPDKLEAALRARASAINVQVDVIGIGNDTWVTNPFSRRWEKVPGVTLADIADPAALVDTLVQELDDVRATGRQQVDGVDCYRLEGTMASDALTDALPSAEPGHTARVSLWVGEADSLPRRARIAGRLAAGEPDNIVRQLDFSNFDAPVTIQAP